MRHKGYCNAIGKGQPWASVRDVETRQPGGQSIAARRVGWQHGGNGARKPHRGGRVRSVGRLLTVCEQMRSIVGRSVARGQPGRGGGHGPGGGARTRGRFWGLRSGRCCGIIPLLTTEKKDAHDQRLEPLIMG